MTKVVFCLRSASTTKLLRGCLLVASLDCWDHHREDDLIKQTKATRDRMEPVYHSCHFGHHRVSKFHYYRPNADSWTPMCEVAKSAGIVKRYYALMSCITLPTKIFSWYIRYLPSIWPESEPEPTVIRLCVSWRHIPDWNECCGCAVDGATGTNPFPRLTDVSVPLSQVKWEVWRRLARWRQRQ